MKAGAAAHRGNIDNLNALPIQMVTHKIGKKMFQRKNAAIWHHFLVWTAKAQIEHADDIATRNFMIFVTRTAEFDLRVGSTVKLSYSGISLPPGGRVFISKLFIQPGNLFQPSESEYMKDAHLLSLSLSSDMHIWPHRCGLFFSARAVLYEELFKA